MYSIFSSIVTHHRLRGHISFIFFQSAYILLSSSFDVCMAKIVVHILNPFIFYFARFSNKIVKLINWCSFCQNLHSVSWFDFNVVRMNFFDRKKNHTFTKRMIDWQQPMKHATAMQSNCKCTKATFLLWLHYMKFCWCREKMFVNLFSNTISAVFLEWKNSQTHTHTRASICSWCAQKWE